MSGQRRRSASLFDSLVWSPPGVGSAASDDDHDSADPDLSATLVERLAVAEARISSLVAEVPPASVSFTGLRPTVIVTAPPKPLQAPPRPALWLIDVLVGRGELTADDEEGMVGDYRGWFEDRIPLYGNTGATLWLWWQALRLLLIKIRLGKLIDTAARVASLLKTLKDILGP